MINKKILTLLSLCMFVVSSASASVIMTGTRVVFPSNATEKVVQFKNPDPQPFVVQLKITKENNETDDNSPFTLVPPVFRMEPNSGHSVRLIANGTAALPQDKESIFYLNFTQLPALKASQQHDNQLVIAVTSRVKIFYRPVALSGSSSEASESLKFSLQQGNLAVTNPTGFYITVREADLTMGKNVTTVATSVMIPPKSTVQWHTAKNISTLNGASLKLILVNDYGADFTREIHL